ncbi:eukaryotic translation initiation factor 3 subunit 8 N-terminus-domain-containing protein [Chytridium lagenaria]|nr:eukaryotic translation initiation factor 3 subunit 8 N-terminus-domain-containing protein [Chytridium lagenaria]
MSRFFRAGSDSDSDSGSDFSESESEKSVVTSSDDSSDSDKDSDDSDGEKQKKTGGKGKFLKKGAADDSDDDDEEDGGRKKKKGAQRSAKDKRYDDMRTIAKLLNNGKKINDWAAIQNEFDRLNRAYAKTAAVIEREGGPKPRFYFRTLAILEDFVKDTLSPEKKETVKKMNALNAKALNAMKQKVKKHNKLFEADIDAWRANPITEEESADEVAVVEEEDYDVGPGGRKLTVLEKFGKRPEKAKPSAEESVPKVKKVKPKKVVVKEEEQEEDDGEGGFTAVGKSGKAIESCGAPRCSWKEEPDKVGQISNFQRLLEVASSPYQKTKMSGRVINDLPEEDIDPVVAEGKASRREDRYFEKIKNKDFGDMTAMRRVEHLYFKNVRIRAALSSVTSTTSLLMASTPVPVTCFSCPISGAGSSHDIQTQILFNRTMVQLGLCAFRSGLIKDAASALQEISSTGKVKELLAQGFQLQRYAEKSPEQEKLEKSRQLPFHMHINLELLERKIISKPFRRMLDYNERQVLLIKEMLATKIQEEGLRTYLFQYSPFYDSLGLDALAQMFELSEATVHAVVSKMIINEELKASLDQPTRTLVLHRPAAGVEVSRLEYLAGVYSEKVASFVDSNEKLLESRSITLGLQQQQQAPERGAYRGRGGAGAGTGGGRGGGGDRGGFRGGRGGGRGRDVEVSKLDDLGLNLMITEAFDVSIKVMLASKRTTSPVFPSVADASKTDDPSLPESSLPISKLRQLTDIEEIRQQLRILNDEESTVDFELDQILKTQDEVERRLDSLDLLRPDIVVLMGKSEKLQEVVVRTAGLAESISKKVRQLDLEQSRVRSAYNLAQEIQDLKDCALGVQQAIKDSDYETAGHHISRFLQFDHVVLDRIFTNAQLVDDSEFQLVEDAALLLGNAHAISMKVLKSAQKMLTDVIVEEFDAAIYEDIPLIGKKSMGLDRFAAYVCGIVSRMCQDWMKDIDEKARTAYADQLTRLFEFTANLIDAQEDLINTHYGGGRFLRVIRVDSIINELAAISQRTELFEKFMKMRAEDQKEKCGDSLETAEELKGIALNSSSNLSMRVRELMANYTTFEEYFIRRSIEKCLGTSDPVSICACLVSLGGFWRPDFVNVFLRKLSTLFATTDSKETRGNCMVLLNNIDVSCEYILKLVKEVSNDIDVLYASRSTEIRSNMRTSLMSISDYSASFKKILMTWVENLFNQTIKPRLRTFLQDSYKDVKYNITEEEYAEQESQDLFVKRFINTLSKVLAPYKKSFSERNYNQTIAHCIDAFVKEWERYILSNHKFNQLGGLRLDKDVRALTSYLVNLTKWSMRDKFSRLSQIAILMNLEKLAEIHEVWGAKAGGVQWRLTVNEVKRYMALRVDFKAEEIAALQL